MLAGELVGVLAGELAAELAGELAVELMGARLVSGGSGRSQTTTKVFPQKTFLLNKWKVQTLI